MSSSAVLQQCARTLVRSASGSSRQISTSAVARGGGGPFDYVRALVSRLLSLGCFHGFCFFRSLLFVHEGTSFLPWFSSPLEGMVHLVGVVSGGGGGEESSCWRSGSSTHVAVSPSLVIYIYKYILALLVKKGKARALSPAHTPTTHAHHHTLF